jgi:hypothetical protein
MSDSSASWRSFSSNSARGRDDIGDAALAGKSEDPALDHELLAQGAAALSAAAAPVAKPGDRLSAKAAMPSRRSGPLAATVTA